MARQRLIAGKSDRQRAKEMSREHFECDQPKHTRRGSGRRVHSTHNARMLLEQRCADVVQDGPVSGQPKPPSFPGQQLLSDLTLELLHRF